VAIPFKAMVRKSGSDTYEVTIPKSYITNGIIKEGRTYEFIIGRVIA